MHQMQQHHTHNISIHLPGHYNMERGSIEEEKQAKLQSDRRKVVPNAIKFGCKGNWIQHDVSKIFSLRILSCFYYYIGLFSGASTQFRLYISIVLECHGLLSFLYEVYLYPLTHQIVTKHSLDILFYLLYSRLVHCCVICHHKVVP